MAAEKTRLPPSYGYLEHVAENGAEAEIGGWLLDLSGAFDRIEVRCDGRAPLIATTFARPDLVPVIQVVTNVERAGFVAKIPTAWAGPDGVLELRVVGLRGGAPAAKMLVGLHHWKERPFPPGEVMERSAGNRSRALYLAMGVKSCNDFLRAVEEHMDLGAIGEFLEWGASAGRITRHFVDRLPHARVHGTDIDVEAVQWAAANVDGGIFVSCGFDPPLPYRDGQFDVVVNLSVFTHLRERYQHVWLAELRRVLRPGGLMLASTHGPHAARIRIPDPEMQRRFLATGFSDEIPSHELGIVASGDYYRATFQTREWTERTFGRYFQLLDYVEGGISNLQDLYVLKKGVK